MRPLKTLITLACFALCLFAAQTLRADKAWTTPLTLSEPTEIPGTVLQPGDYVVRVENTNQARQIVQFLSPDQSKVIATVMAVPDYRAKTTDETRFVYFQRAEGMPQAIKSWFYPANYYGIEFVYPKVEAVKIAQTSHERVYVFAEPQQEKVIVITPELKEEPAPPPPVVVAENKPLPKTASNLPLVALAGLAALGVAGTLRILSSRQG
ncbi:MAG TPA: hypothetical protein VMR54_14695 [Thermoanaerobaculia bacterium]|nr:hypothetical protein [Thermoanaerobaculia bacterium]